MAFVGVDFLMKVFLKHEHMNLWMGINADLKVFVTNNKNFATHFQSTGAWSPTINNLWNAGFDTRNWSCAFEFSK
jgi:hypothetical protein